MTTIIQLIESENFGEVAKLIQKGKYCVDEQDDNGLTPLHLAVIKGHTATVHQLLEAGFNPNTRSKIDESFYDGEHSEEAINENQESVINTLRNLGNKTPLHICAKESLINVAKILLAYGACPNILDAGLCTPLHWSAAKGDHVFAELLLLNNANVNVQDIAYSTPLHESTRNGHIEMVKLLLRYQANSKLKDICGATPFDIAKQNDTLISIFVEKESMFDMQISLQ